MGRVAWPPAERQAEGGHPGHHHARRPPPAPSAPHRTLRHRQDLHPGPGGQAHPPAAAQQVCPSVPDSVYLTLSVPDCLSLMLSHPDSVCLSLMLSVPDSVCLSLTVCLTPCLSDSLSPCLSVWLPVCLSPCLKVPQENSKPWCLLLVSLSSFIIFLRGTLNHGSWWCLSSSCYWMLNPSDVSVVTFLITVTPVWPSVESQEVLFYYVLGSSWAALHCLTTGRILFGPGAAFGLTFNIVRLFRWVSSCWLRVGPCSPYTPYMRANFFLWVTPELQAKWIWPEQAACVL